MEILIFKFELQGSKAFLLAGTLFFRIRPPEGECFAPHIERVGANSMPGGYNRSSRFKYMILNVNLMTSKISHIL